MAEEEEEEVSYASVVFKSNKHPRPEAKEEEETVYDEVKKSETIAQTADANVSAGVLPDKKANNRSRMLACCLGILCVISLLAIIAVCVYLATLHHHVRELKDNQATLRAEIHSLKKLNLNLSSDNDILRSDHTNLTVQFDNLTQTYAVLESKITNLTAENQNLTTQVQQLNQELETQKNNLTEQIQDIETNWKELNGSRAQWSIDNYCPKINNVRKCKPCQKGWEHNKSSCYVIHNAPLPERITWEEARGNCRGKNSDLVVAHNQTEKDTINYYSWYSSGTNGYWIGLRVVDGRWKWIDGSDLTNSSWIEAPTEGHCAMSVQNVGWKSVSCDDRKQWICKQSALSV